MTLDYVDWSNVTCFHLDEYIGLQEDHPASFVKYARVDFNAICLVKIILS